MRLLSAPALAQAPRRSARAGCRSTRPANVAADLSNRWSLELSSGGTVVVQLRPDAAPLAVERIKTLTRQGFYNGLIFHRVIPGFMAQGGDPKGDGSGGSELPDVKAEFNAIPHLRGTRRRRACDQPGQRQQPVLHHVRAAHLLDNKYTVFGRVVSGMNFVDQIAPGEPPAEPTQIVRATLGG